MKRQLFAICIASCVGFLAFGCGVNESLNVYDTPFGGTGPSALTQCEAGEHFFNGNCEANSIENCGEHGNACEVWQICDNDEGCIDRPCDYFPKESRSPALCAGDDQYVLFCGSHGTYYLAQSGYCSAEAPCVVCPDGFGGCSGDADSFCQNHQKKAEQTEQNTEQNTEKKSSYIPKTCVKNAYPPMCVNNTGYICGDTGYYSSYATRCNNSDTSCVVCDNGYVGCTNNPETFCAEKRSIPMYDPNSCVLGHKQCDGKRIMECDGKSYSKFVEKCDRYCADGTDGEDSYCTDKIPKCTLKENSKATILAWNDGDTVVLTPKWTGLCSNNNDKMRISARVLGVDTPECSKAKNKDYGINTCIEDDNWSDTNDPFGYEAWKQAMNLFPPGTEVTLTCDAVDEYNNCTFDKGGRPLAYLSANGYDFSTQMMLSGLAMPNIQYVPRLTTQEKGVCESLEYAMKNRLGLWSECTEANAECIKQGAARLQSTKSHEFDKTYARCQYIFDMMAHAE